MRTLRLNDKGDDVEAWEYFLRGQNFYWLEVDGFFDPETDEATKAFQREHFLDDDGVVGNKTYAVAATLGFAIAEDSSTEENGPNWPPPPPFKPIPYNDRFKVFGNFRYKPAGLRNNPEAITVLDGWYGKNIERVEIPQLSGVKGTAGRTSFDFNKQVSDQVKGFFEAVEKLGLKNLILTWGGSYAPRFVRGSQTYLSNHCLPAQEPVWTPNGPIPIADLKGCKDHVWSYDDGVAITKPIVNYFSNGKKPILKIEINGNVIRCTPNHPIMVLRKKTLDYSEWYLKKDGKGKVQAEYWTEMVRAENLRKGDRVVSVRSLPELCPSLQVDNDWAEILGLFIGDGCLHHRNGAPNYISFSIPKDDRIRKYAINLLTRYFKTSPKEVSDGCQLAYYNRNIYSKFIKYDKKAHEKTIPEEIWNWDAKSQARFLLGYLYSDGYVAKTKSSTNNNHTCTFLWKSASKKLIEGLKQLLSSLGFKTRRISYSPPKDAVICGVPCAGKGYWQTGGLDIMGVLNPDADPMYLERIKAAVHHRKMDTKCWGYETLMPNFTHHAIRNISSDGEEEVFDIEVEGTHNFLNRGIVVSNSFGTAFDINVPWNGLGITPALKGKKGSVRELVETAYKFGLYWGGYFKRKDGMHFEVAVVMSEEEVQKVLSSI